MIQKLQIRNYRRNKKLDIEFDRITVLRGASGKGKTSAMGALKWVTFNQPTGTGMINWDSKTAKVRVIAERNKITRIRGESKNTYEMDGELYEAFGTGVPSSISNSLNVSSLNFHNQHAGPFWFSQTAGEVSRQLNKIVNLDIIDRTISNLNREQRNISTRIKDINQRIKEAQETKDSLKYTLSMDSELKELERQEQKVAKNAQEALQLANLVKLGSNHLSRIDRGSQRLIEANLVLSIGEKWVKIEGKVEILSGLVNKASKHQDVVSQEIPDISPVNNSFSSWQKINKQYESLSQLVCSADDIEGYIEAHEEELERLDKLFIKKMGKRCVLCGNPLKKKI